METLTADEVADLLKLKRKTVVEKAKNGSIPALKPGRSWVFIQQDVYDWMRAESHKLKTQIQKIKGKYNEAAKLCRSSEEKAVKPITQTSLITARELENQLEQATKSKPKNTKIN